MLQSFEYKLDGLFYPLNDNIDRLTTSMFALKQEIDMIQSQIDFQAEQSPSIDKHTPSSIDND